MDQASKKTLYILRLEDNCWYVGTTKNLERRFQQHTSGKGSEWTKLHKPLKLQKTMECDSVFHEDNITKELMMEFGIENVRGGSYCQIVLEKDQIQTLKREFATAKGNCIVCFKAGHFSKDCPKKKRICERCGRASHSEGKCYAKKHVDGTILDSGEPEASSEEEEYCRRCGREGHLPRDCYAKSGVDGVFLTSTRDDFYCEKCDSHDHGKGLCEPKKTPGRTKGKLSQQKLCERCGRTSHTQEKCFSKRHINGTVLSEIVSTHSTKKLLEVPVKPQKPVPRTKELSEESFEKILEPLDDDSSIDSINLETKFEEIQKPQEESCIIS